MVLNMWHVILKLNEEKSQHAGFVQQNGFGPAIFAELTQPGKKAEQLYRKNVINVIWLLFPIA